MNGKMESLLDVEGMSCASCVRHVEAALRDLDGIGAIEVRLEEGKVRVQHDPELATRARMIRAIEEAGYAAR